MVKRITDENGNVVQEIQPTLLRETISESMILPGNDYEFGVNESGDENRGIHA